MVADLSTFDFNFEQISIFETVRKKQYEQSQVYSRRTIY